MNVPVDSCALVLQILLSGRKGKCLVSSHDSSGVSRVGQLQVLARVNMGLLTSYGGGIHMSSTKQKSHFYPILFAAACSASALALLSVEGAAAQPPECAEKPKATRHHHLPANDKTVHWGYFSKSLAPADDGAWVSPTRLDWVAVLDSRERAGRFVRSSLTNSPIRP